MDTKPDYVTHLQPHTSPDDVAARPPVLDRIRQALLTSRLTLAGHNTGADPYDSRHDRRRVPIWGKRSR